MTIAQEFNEALAINKAEEASFTVLINKFDDLKEVLQSNFKITSTSRKWYGKKVSKTRPVIQMDIEDKITHSSGKYLYIRIGGCGYVMGLGEIGELKDRLYFIEGRYIHGSKGKQVVYVTSHMFGTCDFCLEDKITNVQLFSEIIKKYKQYLITNG